MKLDKTKIRLRFRSLSLVTAAVATFMVGNSVTYAAVEVIEEPPALSANMVPYVPGLYDYDPYAKYPTPIVKNKLKAIQLGKALFWDIQQGSNLEACASCHFFAGADTRVKNQTSPGLNAGNTTFENSKTGAKFGPNYLLRKDDFPTTAFNDPDDRNSGIAYTTNDVVSSSGTFGGKFIAVAPRGRPFDRCARDFDPLLPFHAKNSLDLTKEIGVKKVEPRNTPTVLNAALQFRTFWDGRANNIFNGVNPFGKRTIKFNEANGVNSTPRLYLFNGNSLDDSIRFVSLKNSALASQAVGPPLSDFEMGCGGRGFRDLGYKLVNRKALALQKVHAQDSVLGGTLVAVPPALGLKKTYLEMIKEAFNDEYWKGTDNNGTCGKSATGALLAYCGKNAQGVAFKQFEANFSLFWGLAVQAYEATLITDQAKFDQVKRGTASFTAEEAEGFRIFMNEGKCVNCHKGPDFTGAGIVLQKENEENGLVERMIMGDGNISLYDNGFYNIGVTPTNQDIGVGGTDAFGNPLSFSLQFRNNNFIDPFEVDPCTFEEPFVAGNCSLIQDLANQRVAVNGSFKTPSLRNLTYTAPFFHNGSALTIRQVVEFYNRGGNFSNQPDQDPDINQLGLDSAKKNALIAFLKTLNDRRVLDEKGPFDHPALTLFHGHPGDQYVVQGRSLTSKLAVNTTEQIPAVGKNGRAASGIAPVKVFECRLAGLPAGQCVPTP